MHLRYIILLCWPMLFSGCACMLAHSGTNVYELPNRDEVHTNFGTPKAVGLTNDSVYEDYHTRRKIADPIAGSVWGISSGMTLGLMEPFGLAVELCRLVHTGVVGHDVRFIYDENGEVLDVECAIPEYPPGNKTAELADSSKLLY